MADLTLPSRVDVTEFTIAPWAPGQSEVDLIYKPAMVAAGPAQTGWGGTVRLAPRTGGDGDWASADRELAALRGRMRGNRHRVRLPLPKDWAGEAPPNGATTALTRATVRGEAVDLTVTPSGWGAWTPTPGSYMNIGDALYLVDGYSAGVITAVPGVEPLGLRRSRGIRPTPGGGNPSNVTTRGLGQYRGSLYSADITSTGSGSIYWIDIASGTRREAVTPANNMRSLGTAYGNLYANIATSAGTSLARVSLDLASPDRNFTRMQTVLTLTGLPTTGGGNRLRGLAEWQAPDDDGPKAYVAVGNTLYRSNSPFPTRSLTTAFTSFFTAVTGPTGFTRIEGLSAGPGPEDPLYILDAGANKIYTWDGTVQADFAEGTVGATEGPNVLRLSDCQAIEWYRGVLYVGSSGRGTTEATLARVNWDTPADALDFTWTDPFVWARLSGGPSGPRGRHFPPTTFSWTEVPTQ